MKAMMCVILVQSMQSMIYSVIRLGFCHFVNVTNNVFSSSFQCWLSYVIYRSHTNMYLHKSQTQQI